MLFKVSQRSRNAALRMAGGLAAISVPVSAWWWWAQRQRAAVDEAVRTKIRLPAGAAADPLQQFIEDNCQPGDVLLFDRRCETCATSPWAALACVMGKSVHCGHDPDSVRSVSDGNFDHIGIIVPGYIKSKADSHDPSNLLLLEATAGQGIVARPLQQRLEYSQARQVILLPLQVPGERRNAIGGGDYDEAFDSSSSSASSSFEKQKKSKQSATASPKASSAQAMSAARTRAHLERELIKFRNTWTELSQTQNYRWMHSTLTIGGAIVAALCIQPYLKQIVGDADQPVAPNAWLTLMALQQGAAATNLNVDQRVRVTPEDFLRHPTLHDDHAVRLRPGWRFLAPVHVQSR